MNSTPDINDKFPETNVITDFLHFGAMKSFSGPVSTVDCFEDNSFVKKNCLKKVKEEYLLFAVKNPVKLHF